MSETICTLSCQHGASCIVTDAGSSYCDCNADLDGTSTNPPFVAVGILCEYLATSWCIPFEEGELFSAVSFCANNGSCSGKALPGEPHAGCICPIGFEGEHCEFIVEGAAPDLTEPPVSPPSSPPSTFFSTVSNCPDGHRCDNGSTCTEYANGEGSYYCDCANLEVGVYAGLYCEHIATSFCTFNQEAPSDSFCTNGGLCAFAVVPGEAYRGCNCPPRYTGVHCEFVEGTNPANLFPSVTPTITPITSSLPSSRPTKIESAFPSDFPSITPSSIPSSSSFPSSIPSSIPSSLPSSIPSSLPSSIPSSLPSSSSIPSSLPSSSYVPSFSIPSQFPTSPSSRSAQIMSGSSDGILALILTAVVMLAQFVG